MDWWEILREIMLFYARLIGFAAGAYVSARIAVQGWDDESDEAHIALKIARGSIAIVVCGIVAGQFGETGDLEAFTTTCLTLVPLTLLVAFFPKIQKQKMSYCNARLVRPNKSFKPTPLRGAAEFWR